MSPSTIILIIVALAAGILILVALGLTMRNKRTEKRRTEAGVIRDKATEQSHSVAQREALAEEIAAKSRAAQAEAEAMAAQAARLEHQAQQHGSDAATARAELDREYARADKLDPPHPKSAAGAETTEDTGGKIRK